MNTNTLILGDCLEEMKKIPSESVDLILTDPPYNTGMSQKTSKDSTRLSHFFDDCYTDEDYLKLVQRSSQEFYRVLKNNKSIYIYMNWKKYPIWFKELENVGFQIKACIVWDKMIHGLGSQYKYQHEFIIFGNKGNPLIKQPKEMGRFFTDLWRIQRINATEKQHDTQKALLVVEIPMTHGSNEGDLVLDPFMGSGTTGVACKTLNRNFIGIEISEKYFKVAQNRINNMPDRLL